MKVRYFKIFLLALLLWQCGNRDQEPSRTDVQKQAAPDSTAAPQQKEDSGTMQQNKNVPQQTSIPILCYHHIKANTAGRSPDYTISTALFRAHLKMLHDSGFHAVLPAQLYQHLTTGAPLPPWPVMVSFDDGHAEHFSIAAPELERYGFKGTFFIMGIVIGKPAYITSEQIKELAARGHAIGNHTWDHPDLRKVEGDAWDGQLVKTSNRLQQITGQPVEFLAYPNGAWNDAVVKAVKERGYKAAFQLTQKQSETEPLYTIRRLLVTGSWSAADLYKRMKK